MSGFAASCENLPVRGVDYFPARAHGSLEKISNSEIRAASAGSFVQFGVARSVSVSHALERGLRVAARFPGRGVTVLRHAVMRVVDACTAVRYRWQVFDAISRNYDV